MKWKDYLSDCAVGGPQRRPIIIITHDESIFSANDGRHQAWIPKDSAFLRPKGKGKGIMVSDFLLPWSRLNLYSLPKAQQDQLAASGVPLEVTVSLEYGNDKGHWDGEKLLHQILDRAVPIAEALYPGYELLFLFDNATSHSIYADDTLRTQKMNKGEGGEQPFLRDGWFKDGDTTCIQPMWYSRQDPATGALIHVQKGIQQVLEERKLWPRSGLNLECPKPKCATCLDIATCKKCIKGIRCDSCKEKKVHSSNKCAVGRLCDECERQKARCQCVPKQFCKRCQSKQKGKCQDCESLPPKCDSDGQFYTPYT